MDYYKIMYSFKQHFLWVMSSAQISSLLTVSPDGIKGSAGLCFYLEAQLRKNPLQVPSDFWQNSFSCSCKTEGFDFLLDVS